VIGERYDDLLNPGEDLIFERVNHSWWNGRYCDQLSASNENSIYVRGKKYFTLDLPK
jgi:hypothetical protein